MRLFAAVIIVLSWAAPTGAGQGTSAPQPDTPINVDRLPIDLKRIQKELRLVEERDDRDALHLRYRLEIYGVAPPLDLFSPEANLLNGPVPYGAPTHQEILNLVTPQEYRSPPMDISNLLRWLSDRNKKKP